MTVEQNIELVSGYFEAMTRGDIDASHACLDDSGTWWSNQRRTHVPMGEFKVGSRGSLKKMPFRFEVHDIWGKDDQVVVECESFATRPNGKPYNNVYCFVFEIEGGKIHNVREYADTLEASDLPREIKDLNKH